MRYGLATAAVAVVMGASAAMAAEVTVRAVAPWPKTHPLTKSFLRFIDKTNAAGKGVLRIKFMGGPEVTKAREQPKAMRNGLFDLIYGPPGYYLGIFPEGDFTHGFKTPMEARANGGYDMIRKAMKEKMNARFIVRFDSGLGLYLFLRKAPKRTASGSIDLSGL
jgi:TRAP-type mannitol/chloroaromatic compound transport system substrate-binding protein